MKTEILYFDTLFHLWASAGSDNTVLWHIQSSFTSLRWVFSCFYSTRMLPSNACVFQLKHLKQLSGYLFWQVGYIMFELVWDCETLLLNTPDVCFVETQQVLAQNMSKNSKLWPGVISTKSQAPYHRANVSHNFCFCDIYTMLIISV